MNLKEKIEKLNITKKELKTKKTNMIERRISNDLYNFEGYIVYSPKKWKWWYLIHYYSESNDVLNFIEYIKNEGYDAIIYRKLNNDIRKILFWANFYYQILIKKAIHNGKSIDKTKRNENNRRQ